jgi:hypothetical protein
MPLTTANLRPMNSLRRSMAITMTAILLGSVASTSYACKMPPLVKLVI